MGQVRSVFALVVSRGSPLNYGSVTIPVGDDGEFDAEFMFAVALVCSPC